MYYVQDNTACDLLSVFFLIFILTWTMDRNRIDLSLGFIPLYPGLFVIFFKYKSVYHQVGCIWKFVHVLLGCPVIFIKPTYLNYVFLPSILYTLSAFLYICSLFLKQICVSIFMIINFCPSIESFTASQYFK